MLIDSHCHLDYPDFAKDRDEVIARARAAGVKLMVTISCKITQADKIISIAQSYEDVMCSVGIHPHEADTEPETDAQTLIDLAKHPKVIGIGETGLDYYYEHSSREQQKKNFRHHIEAARISKLPLIVHARDADTDTADILEQEYAKAAFPGLIHCFTASAELAKRVLDIGMYISISGIATFKSAQDLRDVIKTIPLERLLVETDAPWLAPVPHRGKRNEPSFVKHTAQLVADVKGVTLGKIEAQTCENFFRLFTKAPKIETGL